MLGDDLADHTLAVLAVGDVALVDRDRHGALEAFIHLGDEFRGPLRVAAVAGGDRRALPGEARADGRADAARPAGDQGDAAGQLRAGGHASARTRAMTVSGSACSGTAANARSDSPSGPAPAP